MQAWIDGELVPAREARVSVFDRGFRSGEGVFETFRAYGSHVFRRDDHIRRATAGADVLGFELDASVLSEAVEATIAANLDALDGQDSVVRLTATPGQLDPDAPWPSRTVEGPTIVVTSHPLAVDDDLHREGVSATAVPWSRELPSVKAVSYLSAAMARRQAQAQGAYEALLTDDRGHVLEGASSNVFAVTRGTLVTPPLSAGLLAGVTRSVVLEVAAADDLTVEERPLTLADLTTADEAFLTATTREVIPLVRVAGQRIGTGRPGPITQAIHEGYRATVRRESTGQG